MKEQRCSVGVAVTSRVLDARLGMAAEGLTRMAQYRSFVATFESCRERTGLNTYLLRETRDVEQWARRGLHGVLDSLNELTDSGALSQLFSGQKSLDMVPSEMLLQTLAKSDDVLEAVDSRLLQEAADLLSRYVPAAQLSSNSLRMTFRDDDGKESVIRLGINRKAVSRPRMTPDRFFSTKPAQALLFPPEPLLDCHHQREPSMVVPARDDFPPLYDTMVGSLAAMREHMYAYVGEMESVGVQRLSGGAGAAAGIIIGFIIFLVLSFAIAAIVFKVKCDGGDSSKCTLATAFGIVAALLTVLGGVLLLGGTVGQWNFGPVWDPEDVMKPSVN